MTTSKKIIIIVSYVLLVATIVGSLFYYIVTIKDKEGTINKLESNSNSLQSKLTTAKDTLSSKEAELNAVKSNLADTEAELENKEALLESALADLQEQIDSTLYWIEDSNFWMDLFINSDPANVTYSYFFTSVNELLTAIHDKPWLYQNKQVKVLGKLYNEKFDVCDPYLVDYEKGESFPDNIISGSEYDMSDLAAAMWKHEKEKANQIIDITLSSDTHFTVDESGNDVKMYGTVRISGGEIYLDN